MEKIVKMVERLEPKFSKISRNIYLQAIRDGFFTAMPVILFSSIFMLIAYVPNIFGFYWSNHVEQIIVKPYLYTMGIFGIVVTGMVAKKLTESFNRELPNNKRINSNSVLIASIASFLLVSSDLIEGGFSSIFMGTAGLLTGFIVAFIVPNIYKFFTRRDIGIKLPEEVPPNITQAFLDVLPFAVTIIFFWLFDLFIRNITGDNFAVAVQDFFKPIFSVTEGYLGMAIVYGAVPLLAFVGVHGYSVVGPAVSAIWYSNMVENLQMFQAGKQASLSFTEGVHFFVAGMGGSGATLIITLLFAFVAKSKKNKAIGKAALLPVVFGVNEPILYGAPIVLNPVFFIPFVLTPIINSFIFKIFVDVLKMNSFMYAFPWTTPAPIGLIMGVGFAKLSLILLPILLIVDFIIYYPFFKVYDNLQVKEEKKVINNKIESDVDNIDIKLDTIRENILDDEKHILVLCYGSGTSGQLANSINKGAKENNVNVSADAGAYGTHYGKLDYYDLIVLAPQVSSHYDDLVKDASEYGTKVITTEGAQYIALARDSTGALNYALENLTKD